MGTPLTVSIPAALFKRLRVHAGENGKKKRIIVAEAIDALEKAMDTGDRLPMPLLWSYRGIKKEKLGTQLDDDSAMKLERLAHRLSQKIWVTVTVALTLYLKDGVHQQQSQAFDEFLDKGVALWGGKLLGGKRLKDLSEKRLFDIPEGDPFFVHWTLLAAAVSYDSGQSESSQWALDWIKNRYHHGYTSHAQLLFFNKWMEQQVRERFITKNDCAEKSAAWAGRMIAKLLESALSVYSLSGLQVARAAKLSKEIGIGFETAAEVIMAKDAHREMHIAIVSDEMAWEAAVVNRSIEQLGWKGFRCTLFYPRLSTTGFV